MLTHFSIKFAILSRWVGDIHEKNIFGCNIFTVSTLLGYDLTLHSHTPCDNVVTALLGLKQIASWIYSLFFSPKFMMGNIASEFGQLNLGERTEDNCN